MNKLCVRPRLCDLFIYLFFQDWEDRYINENYTRIMKDKLIETVSSNI